MFFVFTGSVLSAFPKNSVIKPPKQAQVILVNKHSSSFPCELRTGIFLRDATLWTGMLEGKGMLLVRVFCL
jgi:hypothetical protein